MELDHPFSDAVIPKPQVLQLDLQKHTNLKTLVISQDSPFWDADTNPDYGYYEITELNTEFLVCLRSIDLPPILETLRVRIFVPEVGSTGGPAPQIGFPEEYLEPGWHRRSPTLDSNPVNLVQRSCSIQRLEVCLIPFPKVKIARDELLEFEAFFPLTKKKMGSGFEVKLDTRGPSVYGKSAGRWLTRGRIPRPIHGFVCVMI